MRKFFFFIFMFTLTTSGNAEKLRSINEGESISDVPPARSAYGWELDYYKDEFDENDYSKPYIRKFFKGSRNKTFDCHLGIRLSNVIGVEFGIIEDMQMINYSGMRITASFNNSKYNVPYTLNGSSLIVNDPDILQKLITNLDTKGVLKLSFYRVDSYGVGHNRVFVINTPTNWSKAYHTLIKINKE